MKYPSAKNMMLCWNPDSDQVKLIPWPDTAGHSERKSGKSKSVLPTGQIRPFLKANHE